MQILLKKPPKPQNQTSKRCIIIPQLRLDSNADHDLVNHLKIGFEVELEILLLFKIREQECFGFFFFK